MNKAMKRETTHQHSGYLGRVENKANRSHAPSVVVSQQKGRNKLHKQEQLHSISLIVRDVKGAKTNPTHHLME